MLSTNLEKAIHANLASQEAIFMALVDPAIIYDHNMNVVKVNNAFINRYGVDIGGLNVKSIISLFSCKWLDESQYLIEEQPTFRALKGEYVSGAIFSIKYLGEEYFVETSSGPVYEDNIITGALTIWHNIDENVKIQKSFLKSEELHRRANDFSPLGVLILKNDIIEYANTTALKMLGASHLLDIEGKSASDFIHPDYKVRLSKKIENLKSGKVFEEAEQKIISLNGKPIDVEIKAVNISSGNDVIFKIFLQDVSSQKKIIKYNNVLNLLGQEILSSHNILDITQKAMEMVAESIECDSAAVSFYNVPYWEVKHDYKFTTTIKGLLIPLEEEPHALIALREKKIIFIEDTSVDSRVNNQRLQNWGIQSAIVVPLYTKYENIGAIFFNYFEKKIYNHEEVYFLMRFSTTLSLALENSALFDNLQQELDIKKENEKKLLKLNSTLRALSRSSLAMVHATDEKKYMSQICDIIIEDCNHALAFVGIIEGENITPVAQTGADEGFPSPRIINIHDSIFSKGPSGTAISQKKPFVCNKINNNHFEPWRKLAIKYDLGSCVSLPLIYQESVLGILNIYSSEPDFFTDEEVDLLSELAKYLTQGIISIRLNNEKKIAEENLKEKARELKELNATKDKFFGIIAHDLRNPFSNLIGSSELLATTTNYSPEVYQRLGKVINESARKGYSLLQNLLDWSRSQTGTISFKPEPVILQQIVEESWSLVKASALNKHQEFEMLVDCSFKVFVDVNMLSTIVRNLLQNAVKFTPHYGKITVSALNNISNITVIIEDSGIGMSPQEIEMLFRIDVKFSNTGTSKEPGTGLGLLLCKEFIEKHKGKIWVTSTEGKGSKFYFSIPAES